MEMAVKTCIQQKYAIYTILKAECTHRGAKKCKFGDEHTIFVEQFT
jgi:hypothetical protein